MTYQPPLEVSADLINEMRRHAYRSAFLASMLDLIRRNGGLSENQIAMVKAETRAFSNRRIAEAS